MKLERLTPEQEELLIQVKDDWIKFALLDGDKINEKQARDGINWLYHISGLSQPITIIVDSPLGVQYGVYFAKELLKNLNTKGDWSQVESQVWSQVWSQVESQVGSQVGSQVESQVWSQVWSQVESQVGSQVESQVWSQVRSQVESQVWSQVWSQVGSQVWSQVGSQVRSQVWSQVESQNIPLESFAGDTLAYWASWTAWAEAFEKLGIVKHSDYGRYKKFMRSGVFMGVYLDGLAVVCRRPSAIRRDDNNNLHSDQLPAIEWRDGYKLHYLDGVAFQEDEWQKIVSQEMTLEDLAKNAMGADKSAIAIKYLRPDRLLEHCKAELIHTGKKGTKLYRVKNFMDTGDTEYCMLMKHPSIDRQYLEWVEPKVGEMKDADLAQCYAWQDEDGNPIPTSEYLEAVEA